MKRQITGYVAHDPKTITTDAGRELAVFRVAENHRAFDQETGAWRDAGTSWYNVAVGKERLRENVMASVTKGQRVTIDGNYEASAFIDSNGEARVDHRMWADDVAASMMHEPQQRMPAEWTPDGPGTERSWDVEADMSATGAPPRPAQAPQTEHGVSAAEMEAQRYTTTDVERNAAGPEWGQ